MNELRSVGHKDVFLGFSCGKDSLAAWIRLRDFGFTVHPWYQYYIPNLEFVEDNLTYYENKFKTKIVRLPHPNFYRWIHSDVFQTHTTSKIIDAIGVPDVTSEEIRKFMLSHTKLPIKTFSAYGTSAFDSVARYIFFKKLGPISYKGQKLYPLFDFKKSDVTRLLEKSKIKLPSDYRYFKRSFEGPRIEFLPAIKKHFPNDYKKILQWYPLCELEIARYEAFKEK